MIFVDGSVHHLEQDHSEGGAGVVIIGNDLPGGTIQVDGKYFPPKKGRGRPTNQRMELEAVRLGLAFALQLGAKKDDRARPLYLWSDSTYAIGSLDRHSGWSPSSNMDLIVPIQRLVASIPRLRFRHVRSHLSKKSSGQLPDFLFHEMADVAARAVVQHRRDTEHIASQARLDPVCVACQEFACWQDDDPLKTMKIREGGTACEKFTEWDPWGIQDFRIKDMKTEGRL